MPSPFLSPTGSNSNPSSHSNSPKPIDPQKRTLLIVDDEEGPRLSIRAVFKEEFNILMTDNGTTAVELAEQHVIDAAVLDIRMVEMSGIELLNRLKKIDPGIEVVMLTAYETTETARQALRLGACDYLTKPFDIPTLREAVHTAMERRAVSNELRANNRRLQELQKEITTYKLREEMARSQGEIYASIIHDINGPLTVIPGYIELLNRQVLEEGLLGRDRAQMAKDYLNTINRQIQNCTQISRRYLNYLRTQGQPESQVEVNQILTDLAELLRVHPAMHKNQLVVSRMTDGIQAQINGTDLMQILLNLTINALQCSNTPHRVVVSGQCLTLPVDLAALNSRRSVFLAAEKFRPEDSLLVLSVEDNGSGIPEELLPKIFEPYFTTKPRGQGTGLGLPIVKRLVHQANGAILLETNPGQGTRFAVYLRKAAPPA
ncbi:MAG: response regulator [Verrucomicrobiota bacterium]